MRRRHLAYATLALAVLLALFAGTSHAWLTNVSGTPPESRALAVAIDGAGNVLAAGRVTDAIDGDDALVVKLDGLHGTELWQRTLAGNAPLVDQLRSVTHDANDAVVVAGQTNNLNTGSDALVAKYEADGGLVWRMDIDGGAKVEDDALAVAVDDTGDVVFAGRMTPPLATKTRFSVLRRAGANGTHVWRADLAGEPGAGRALVLAGGYVYAAGDVDGLIVVVKISDVNGVQQWRTDVAGSTVKTDFGRAVALGGGRVVVAGRMVTVAGGNDFAVVALDEATGAEVWRYVQDGAAVDMADNDDAFGVAVDAAGDVIAVGRLSDPVGDDDLAVVKLAGADGAEVWRRIVNGGNNNNDDAQAVALDAAGDAFVVGSIRYPRRGRDFFAGKFAGTTGLEQWRLELDGTESAGDFGSAIALSADGDAVFGGRLRNGTDGDGFAVVKRTGNGGDFPCANGDTDPGEECDDGNVTPGDGCRGNCTIEVCGDGIHDPQEACDDSNVVDGDCCSATCTIEPDGSTCDDGDACTLGDACVSGTCTPSDAIVCVADGPCFDAVCDPADGSCSSPPKPDGATCNDGNACTLLDRCVDGVCTSPIGPTCDDHDACTLDGCAPASGCVHDPLTEFDAVTCVLERDTIADACGPTIPRPLLGSIERIRGLVRKAATSSSPRRARKTLGRAIAAAKGVLRKTAKFRNQQRLNDSCAVGITETLNDLVTRATAMRKELASSS